MPVAAVAGVGLPGCECGSVPIAGRLVARGVAPAAALTFLLSAPAVNPVVLVATAVAFPGRPEMVLARFLASLLAACVVGFVWIAKGRDEWVDKARRNEREEGSRFGTFVETAEHDFLHAGGFLVIGARDGRVAADIGTPLGARQRRRSRRCSVCWPCPAWPWSWPSARRRTRSWPPA